MKAESGIVTFAAIAIAEVARVVRFIDILFCVWLVVAPWLLSGFVAVARWNDMVLRIALIGMSVPRGRAPVHYGCGDRNIV